MPQGKAAVTTSVDEFIALVKKRGKISIESAASELRVHASVVQTWVDFLVEEQILGLEYQLVTPYVFLLSERKKNSKTDTADSLDSKQEFFTKAKAKNIEETKIASLWTTYVNDNLGTIHQSFKQKASIRGIPSEKIDELWEKYRETLH